MRPTLLAILVFAFQFPASAQTINTIAGTGKPENNGDQPSGANIGDPFGVEFASDGSLYICEVRNHRLWRLHGKGELTVIAGKSCWTYSARTRSGGGGATASTIHHREPCAPDRARTRGR